MRIDNPNAHDASAPDADLQAIEPEKRTGRAISPVGARAAEGVAATPEQSFKGFITGQVIDTDNFAVAGATIKLINLPPDALVFENSITRIGNERAEDPIAVVQSQANGNFAIDGVEPSERWGLVVSHKDYSTLTVAPLVVPENGGLRGQLVELVPGNSLFGSVTAARSGGAIEGAVLSLTSPMAAFKDSDKRGPGDVESVTDSQGNYRFLNTDRGTKTLTIRAPGYATAILSNFTPVPREKTRPKPFIFHGKPADKPLYVAREDTKVIARQFDIQLEPAMSIAGRVLAPDGSGVVGVELQAFCLTAETGSHSKTVSLEGGEFILDDIGKGQYTVSVIARGYQCTPIQRVPAGTTDLEVKLIEQGSVAGRAINDETGRALRKFSATVRTFNEMNISWGQVVRTRNFSDRGNGSFSVTGISAGEYVVEIRAKGLASSFSAPFKVTQGKETPDITIRVTKGGTLRGTVIEKASGKPMAGVKVSSNENNHINSSLMLALGNSGRSAASRREVLTAEDGSFEMALMTPDTYQVQVEAPGYSVIKLNDVKVGDGEETGLSGFAMLKGALLKGYVFDDERNPVPNANVILSPKDQSNHWARRNTRTDSDGHYTLRNVIAGEYEISSTRPRKPGAGFLEGALDMKKSSKEIFLEDGTVNVQDLDFSNKKF